MVKKYGHILILPYQVVNGEEIWSNFNPIPYQIIDGEEIEGDTDVGNLRGTNQSVVITA